MSEKWDHEEDAVMAEVLAKKHLDRQFKPAKCRHHFTPRYGERECLRCHIESLTLMLTRNGVCPACEGVYSKKLDVLRCLNPECSYQHIEHSIYLNLKRKEDEND